MQRPRIHHRRYAPVAAKHHQQVADHGGFALLVQLDDRFSGQLLQGHFDHAHRAFHDGAPGGYDRRGLLALQHGVGDLGGVRQVVDPRFDNFHTGNMQALADLMGQLVVHFIHPRAQGDGGGFVFPVVVAEQPGKLTHGRLALYFDEIRVIFDLENGFEGIADPISDYGTDHDRVALLVVNLDGRYFQRDRPQGDHLLGVERIGVKKAALFDSADVLAE